MKERKNEEIVIGAKNPGQRETPITRVEREKGRYKENGKDHYYL